MARTVKTFKRKGVDTEAQSIPLIHVYTIVHYPGLIQTIQSKVCGVRDGKLILRSFVL